MHARSTEIVERALAYVDCPYRHQGRTWEHGVDCAGLIICVGHDLGLGDFDTIDYPKRPNVHEFDAQIRRSGCVQIPMSEMASGDILRISLPRWPVHCALYFLEDGMEWIVHAYLPYRKVEREPLTTERRAQISSVWRYPEAA